MGSSYSSGFRYLFSLTLNPPTLTNSSDFSKFALFFYFISFYCSYLYSYISLNASFFHASFYHSFIYFELCIYHYNFDFNFLFSSYLLLFFPLFSPFSFFPFSLLPFFPLSLGSVFKTHGPSFTPVYLEHWHEMITEMGHIHCLKEDRQFSFFVISDVIEFGLTSATSVSYLARYSF